MVDVRSVVRVKDERRDVTEGKREARALQKRKNVESVFAFLLTDNGSCKEGICNARLVPGSMRKCLFYL